MYHGANTKLNPHSRRVKVGLPLSWLEPGLRLAPVFGIGSRPLYPPRVRGLPRQDGVIRAAESGEERGKGRNLMLCIAV